MFSLYDVYVYIRIFMMYLSIYRRMYPYFLYPPSPLVTLLLLLFLLQPLLLLIDGPNAPMHLPRAIHPLMMLLLQMAATMLEIMLTGMR